MHLQLSKPPTHVGWSTVDRGLSPNLNFLFNKLVMAQQRSKICMKMRTEIWTSPIPRALYCNPQRQGICYDGYYSACQHRLHAKTMFKNLKPIQFKLTCKLPASEQSSAHEWFMNRWGCKRGAQMEKQRNEANMAKQAHHPSPVSLHSIIC